MYNQTICQDKIYSYSVLLGDFYCHVSICSSYLDIPTYVFEKGYNFKNMWLLVIKTWFQSDWKGQQNTSVSGKISITACCIEISKPKFITSFSSKLSYLNFYFIIYIDTIFLQ